MAFSGDGAQEFDRIGADSRCFTFQQRQQNGCPGRCSVFIQGLCTAGIERGLALLDRDQMFADVGTLEKVEDLQDFESSQLLGRQGIVQEQASVLAGGQLAQGFLDD